MDNPNYDYLTLLQQMAMPEGVEVTLCSDFAGGTTMHRMPSTDPYTIVELHGREGSAAAILQLDDDGRVDKGRSTIYRPGTARRPGPTAIDELDGTIVSHQVMPDGSTLGFLLYDLDGWVEDEWVGDKLVSPAYPTRAYGAMFWPPGSVRANTDGTRTITLPA